MPSKVSEAIREFCERHAVRSHRVLVSLSGGADSTALITALHSLASDLKLQLYAVHFDHGLRPESAEEAHFVKVLCGTLGIKLHIEPLNVSQGEPVDQVSGIEELARNLRYAVLHQLAVSLDCRFVATGHTANDQVETVLQRLLRGTGLWGLVGIRETRPLESTTLIRPLLKLRREELENYLTSIGRSWLEDASNRDLRWTRNRIRHELLPSLREHFNPHVDEHIAQLSEHVQAVVTYVEQEATRLCEKALLDAQPALQKWDVDQLRSSDPLLRGEALRLQWRRLRWSESGMTRPHWESLTQLIDSAPPAMRHLPGRITASRRGNLLVVEVSRG